MINQNMLAAAVVAILSLVCLPSLRWQRLLLTSLSWLARLGVISTLGSLLLKILTPEAAPGSLASLVDAAADRNHLDPTIICLLLAVGVAFAAVPLLAGLDFARSLADDRVVLRALRAAYHALKQFDRGIDSSVVPPAFLSAGYPTPSHAPVDNRRRLGDLVNS
jgi:hypothetical protein